LETQASFTYPKKKQKATPKIRAYNIYNQSREVLILGSPSQKKVPFRKVLKCVKRTTGENDLSASPTTVNKFKFSILFQ
jgi:hypothetical protein